MVSLWPWKRDDSSPASFERALSRLSEQIAKSTIRLDASRTRSRRIKALWTLYTSIAYLVSTLILTLVLGINKWHAAHYAGVLGAPVLIFAVRKLATAFYEWRISSEQAYLDELVKQREVTIEKLKAATKYNSTQELLNKYGGSSAKLTPKGKEQGGTGTKRKDTPSAVEKQQPQGPQPKRTGIAPPPTANIPGRGQQPATPVRSGSAKEGGTTAPSSPNAPFSPEEPGFAPNAFGTSSQPYPQAPSFQPQSPHWYDRILDVLLGEDETLPKNRLALICSNCRLVNGQAPPGVKDLDDIGKWRCGGCGVWNGEESEARKVLQAMRQKEECDRKEGWESVSRGDEQHGDDIKQSIERDPNPSKSPTKTPKTVIPSSETEEDEDEVEEDDKELSERKHDISSPSPSINDNTDTSTAPKRRITRSSNKKAVK